jgi:hypothetical protein
MKRFLGCAALLGVVAVIGMFFGCTTPGASKKAKESRLPDPKGNLQMTNSSGKNSDIFVNDVYLRTIEKGKSNFLLDVTSARDPIGTEVLVKIYDHEAVGSLDNPAEDALMNTFVAALFPPDDQDRLMRIYIPIPGQRDKEGGAAGGREVLVKFEYPLEDIALGTVTATAFEGQINSRRPFVVMSPQQKPIMVPMEVGFRQISILYTVVTNNKVNRFYYPDWNTPGVDESIKTFNTADLNPVYTILPVDQITTVTWMYPKDNLGSLIVKNKSTRPVQLNAANLEPGGKRGLLEQLAMGAAPGSSAMAVSPLAVPFQLRPGQYQLSATPALRGGAPVSALDDVIIEAGTQYYWIITDGSSTLQKNTTLSAATDLTKVIQNWKIRSNVPGAQVTLSIDSSDASIKGEVDTVMGNTDNAGELLGTLSAANLVENLTYGNASKVLIKLTVSKEGYVSVTQTINALTILEAGSDFVPDKFNLSEAANKSTPGAEYKLEYKDFARPYYGD